MLGIIENEEILISVWNQNRVVEWLCDNGFSQHTPNFQKNDIDGSALLELDNKLLNDMGIYDFTEIAYIMNAVRKLRNFYKVQIELHPNVLKRPGNDSATIFNEEENLLNCDTVKNIKLKVDTDITNIPSQHNEPHSPKTPSTPTRRPPTPKVSPSTPNTPLFIESSSSEPPDFEFKRNVPERSDSLFDNMRLHDVYANSYSSSANENHDSFLTNSLGRGFKSQVKRSTTMRIRDAVASSLPPIITPRTSSMKIPRTSMTSPVECNMEQVSPISPRQNSPKINSTSPSTEIFGFLIPKSAKESTHNHLMQNKKCRSERDSLYSTSTSSLASPQIKVDIFKDVEIVRQRCIRVFGTDDQYHIIDVREMNDPKAIKDKIFSKFNIKHDTNSYMLYTVDENDKLDLETPMSDSLLLSICKSPESKLRGQVYLVKNKCTEPKRASVELNEENVIKKQSSLRKLQNFFGTSIPTTKKAIKDEPNNHQSYNFTKHQNQQFKNSQLFGDRPPSALIVNQLEKFFPIIGEEDAFKKCLTENESTLNEKAKLKVMVEEANKNKRMSRVNSEKKHKNRFSSKECAKTAGNTSMLSKQSSEVVKASESELNTLNNGHTLYPNILITPPILKEKRIDTVSTSANSGKEKGIHKHRRKLSIGSINFDNIKSTVNKAEIFLSKSKSVDNNLCVNRPSSEPCLSPLKKSALGKFVPIKKALPHYSSEKLSSATSDNSIKPVSSFLSLNTKPCVEISKNDSNLTSKRDFSSGEFKEDESVKSETSSNSSARVELFANEFSKPTTSAGSIVKKPSVEKVYKEKEVVEPSSCSKKEILTTSKTEPFKEPLVPEPNNDVNEDSNEPKFVKSNEEELESMKKLESESSVNISTATKGTLELEVTKNKEEIDEKEIVEKKSDLPGAPLTIDWIKSYLIGKGSFGKVFLGLNVSTGQFMAVKQVEIKVPGANTNEKHKKIYKKMIDSLYHEIHLLKDLEHENIVQYLGFEVSEEGFVSVFLEYVSGGSVATLLSKIGKFDEILVRSLVYQTLCGLEYLHACSIIHRDIKGANILLDEDGIVKIADLGISKKNEYQMAYKYNSRMSLQGSVFWMAPEVIKGRGYSAKVDIWSLGCVVLEMITGSHPWNQLDEMQTMWKLGKNMLPDIPEWLSSDAKDFLLKCFSIDPDTRPTATELLHHPFVQFDLSSFDFKSYYEGQLKKKKLELEEEKAEIVNSKPVGSGVGEGDFSTFDSTILTVSTIGGSQLLA
ncbi:ATP binding [Clydaea vesicula]|uniref:mitogen-activated protein kinase kinase kinase n=1 Tax=Clydaea vesicula TaxID=447962 RepID=A0AAD5U7X3_9FUNG|nr:ATP binding [Clydaea vesicula]